MPAEPVRHQQRFLNSWADMDAVIAVDLPAARAALFGKNAASETSLRHWYADSRPELKLRRAHSGNIGVVSVTAEVTCTTYNLNVVGAIARTGGG